MDKFLIPIVLFILHGTVSRCFSKDNRVSRMTPRCFWDVVYITLLLLNTGEGRDIALDFRLKIISCTCFLGSGLNSSSTEAPIYLSSPSRYSFQEQNFNKTLCFLFLRNSHKRFSKLPGIPFRFLI